MKQMTINELADHDPEIFEDFPPLLIAYSDVQWSKFREVRDSLTDAAQSAFCNKFQETSTAGTPSSITAFEAVSMSTIKDSIKHGMKRDDKSLYSSSDIEQRVKTTWYSADFDLRKTAIENSLQSMKKMLNFNDEFVTEYEVLIQNLGDCLTDSQKAAIDRTSTTQDVWKVILLARKCHPHTGSHLRFAVATQTAIPASTASVERIFSILFHTRTARRTHLDVNTLEALLTIRVNSGPAERFDAEQFANFWRDQNHWWSEDSRKKSASTLHHFKQRITENVDDEFNIFRLEPMHIDFHIEDRDDFIAEELEGDVDKFELNNDADRIKSLKLLY